MAIPIEKTILDYLNGVLDVPCMMEIPPKKIEPPFVVIQKTGSSVDNRLYRATLAIQSYGGTRYGASTLNEQVKEAMDSAVILDRVTKSKLNSDYDYTDTSTKRYRYQAVYDINHY